MRSTINFLHPGASATHSRLWLIGLSFILSTVLIMHGISAASGGGAGSTTQCVTPSTTQVTLCTNQTVTAGFTYAACNSPPPAAAECTTLPGSTVPPPATTQIGPYTSNGVYTITSPTTSEIFHYAPATQNANCPDVPVTMPSTQITAIVGSVQLEVSGLDDGKKLSPGALVVKNDAVFTQWGAYLSAPPRQEITAICRDVAGLLTADSGLSIFTQASGGTAIAFDGTANKISAGANKQFWVEGETASATSRDKTVTLTPQGAAACPNPDKANFTVLFVDVSANFQNTDTISPDDSAKPLYVAQAGSASLGGPKLFNGPPDRFGFGVEYRGRVSPSDFKPADFGAYILLERDAQTRLYDDGAGALGNGQNLWFSADLHASVPDGNDGSNSYVKPGSWPVRDDDPQSGGSAGIIYDWDDAGVPCSASAVGAVERLRFNAREFACVLLPGGTRCVGSNIYQFCEALSMVKAQGGPDSWTMQGGITGDNSVGSGTLPNVSWNLK